IQQMNALAPFGMSNSEPIFKIEAVPTQLRQIGQEQKHLKLQFKKTDGVIDAIGFSKGHLYYLISEKTPISIVGKLQLNEWNGIKTVQILMEDMAIDEWQLFDYRSKQQEKYMTPFIRHYERNLIVVNDNESLDMFANNPSVQVVTYEVDVSTLQHIDCVFIYDLPFDLKVLQQIIQKTNPNAIHLCFDVTENAFLQTIPNREEFKWLYGFLHQHEPIHLKSDLPQIIQMKKWSKQKAIFMLKVFFDLKFIII